MTNLFSILSGLRIDESVDILQGSGPPGSTHTDQARAGSLYLDNNENGNIWHKNLNGTGIDKWSTIGTGSGGDTSTVVAGSFIASETISSGSLINLWNNSGTTNIRNADADSAKRADGFIKTSAILSDIIIVYSFGINPSLGGLSYPQDYYLGNNGSIVLVPLNASDSANTGKIIQKIGKSINSTTIFATISEPIYL
jgi:hypothetical protein